MKMCSACGIDTAAVGSAVIGNDTAVDIDRAGIPRVVRRNTAAVAGGRVAAGRHRAGHLIVHREAGIASRDGHSAAVSGYVVAGQRAAVERGVCICADTDTAAAGIGAAKRTCANAVAQIQLHRLAILARQSDGRLRWIGAGETVAVQAQIQDVLRRNCQIG